MPKEFRETVSWRLNRKGAGPVALSPGSLLRPPLPLSGPAWSSGFYPGLPLPEQPHPPPEFVSGFLSSRPTAQVSLKVQTHTCSRLLSRASSPLTQDKPRSHRWPRLLSPQTVSSWFPISEPSTDCSASPLTLTQQPSPVGFTSRSL